MKRWNTTRTQYKISDFISWQKSKTLVLNPNFQRRSVWNASKKSYLIDSIYKGLPIPIIFLREQKSDLKSLQPRREVIDGQQRIRTLISYISPNDLPNYDPQRDDFTVRSVHNQDLANKKFKDLSLETQQEILDYEFSVHVLPAKVEDREVLEIFARMNATGVRLNFQELRNAGYFGEFKTSMYELGAEYLPQWREWKLFTEDSIARMQEVELTSELSILILKGISGKSQKAIDNIYKDYDEKYPERNEVERRFRIVMDNLDDMLGSSLRQAKIGKTLFYAIFGSFYLLQFGYEGFKSKIVPSHLINRKNVDEILNKIGKLERKTAPAEALNSLTRRTTDLNSRRTLIKFLLEESF